MRKIDLLKQKIIAKVMRTNYETNFFGHLVEISEEEKAAKCTKVKKIFDLIEQDLERRKITTLKEKEGNEIMKYVLTEKAKNGIEKYREGVLKQQLEINELINKFKQPSFRNRYTVIGFREQVIEGINKVNEEYANLNFDLNKRLNDEIISFKELHIPSFKSIESDYQLKINNALQFLNIGNFELNDEEMFDMLKDFVHDYQTMKLFKRAIESLIKYDETKSIDLYSKTFEIYNRNSDLIELFAELESYSNAIFTYEKTKGEVTIINTFGIEMPDESYVELDGEDKIISICEHIDEILGDDIYEFESYGSPKVVEEGSSLIS